MDFGALPPEVNSGRMYAGPGPATLLAASAAWDALAAELHSAADAFQAALTGLTDESWTGPSSASMGATVAPYLQWMRAAAVQCDQAATRATDAVAAYETAFAMTVPPPAIVANRVRLATLIATNSLGQHAPAIAATEAKYSEMWAQDAAVMYNYAASAATASALEVFTSPAQTTNLSGLVETVSKMQTPSARVVSSVPQALRSLASPAASSSLGLSHATVGRASGVSAPISDLSSPPTTSGEYATKGGIETSAELGGNLPLGGLAHDAAAGFGHANALGALSVPPSWADAASVFAPLPALDANVMPGAHGATPSGGAGPTSKLPFGAMVRREYVRRQARTCRQR
jgi:PPE-repeat protein